MKDFFRNRLLLMGAVVTCLILFLGLLGPSLSTNTQQTLPLRLVADIPVYPASRLFVGQTPRMDYETIDPIRRMLYIAYLGADEIIAFNLSTNTVVAHIGGLSRVHGTLAIPEFHRLYASVTGTDQVVAIDEKSLQVKARTAGGDYPDGIAYDAADRKIFVSDERGGTDTVVDIDTNRAIDSVDVGGEVGNTQYDTGNRLVYSDVQTRNDIVAISPRTDKVVARHKLPGCNHDHGLLLDVPHRLAFVACDGNAKLLVMDLDSWKERAIFPVGKDPDVLAFDAGWGRLYVAAESGVVAVFQEHGRALLPLGLSFVANEAHTVAVDARTHRVYFALESVGGTPTLRIYAGSPIPGVFGERMK